MKKGVDMRISKLKALEILFKHGWEPFQQTACFNGKTVKQGSSFYEVLGNKDFYTVKILKEWLGY